MANDVERESLRRSVSVLAAKTGRIDLECCRNSALIYASQRLRLRWLQVQISQLRSSRTLFTP
uniref:Uncharacterized protein n=1 Tax=Setaria digitata TaxID=48799 RepID=A0A915PE75_9BILA